MGIIEAPFPAGTRVPSELRAFEAFLREYAAAKGPEQRGPLAEAFVERQQAASGFPIVASDGTAVILYRGSGTEHDVRLVGDFKTRGFHNAVAGL